MREELAELIVFQIKEKIDPSFTISDARNMTKVMSDEKKHDTYVIEKNNFLFVAWTKCSEKESVLIQTTALPVHFLR